MICRESTEFNVVVRELVEFIQSSSQEENTQPFDSVLLIFVAVRWASSRSLSMISSLGEF